MLEAYTMTDADLDFMREIREAPSVAKLQKMLRWQACEAWRRVAIEREIGRRIKAPASPRGSNTTP